MNAVKKLFEKMLADGVITANEESRYEATSYEDVLFHNTGYGLLELNTIWVADGKLNGEAICPPDGTFDVFVTNLLVLTRKEGY